MRIGIVQLNVTDLEQALRFYVDTLGFQLVTDRAAAARQPFELDGGPGLTLLVYRVERLVRVPYPAGAGVTIVFHVDDLEATIAAWRAKGVRIIASEFADPATGIASCPYGRFAAFEDPFGNIHEILEPHPMPPTPATPS